MTNWNNRRLICQLNSAAAKTLATAFLIGLANIAGTLYSFNMAIHFIVFTLMSYRSPFE
jgi:hypothetical protein